MHVVMVMGRRIATRVARLSITLSIALLLATRGRVAAAQSAADKDDLHDLPLIELPAAVPGQTLAIVLSGDGGWVDIDKQVAGVLAKHDVAVVGVDMRAYLAKSRSPDQVAHDMSRIFSHYMSRWHRDHVALVGYSRGADVAPFIVTRLSPDLRSHLVLVAMLGIAPFANFHFHWTDVFRDTRRSDDVATLPELERLRGVNMLCVYGAEEKESGCRDAPDSLIRRISRSGAHHFDGDYVALAQIILDALPR